MDAKLEDRLRPLFQRQGTYIACSERDLIFHTARIVSEFEREEYQILDIVFDGPPGPEAGRFVEVETQDGRSVSVGEWVERPDGYWALRIRARGLR